jgi:hypothetical protein
LIVVCAVWVGQCQLVCTGLRLKPKFDSESTDENNGQGLAGFFRPRGLAWPAWTRWGG